MHSGQKNNSDFNFIHYQGTDENNYYRWRVYSYLQGDSDTFWRKEIFMMSENGYIWHPPQIETKRIYFNLMTKLYTPIHIY